jgi:predicted amidohydrolase
MTHTKAQSIQPSLCVASVQFQHQANNKSYNLGVMAEFIQQAAAQSVQVINFPEMCITGYWHVRHLSRADIEQLAEPVPSGPSSQQLLAWARQHQMVIAAGLIELADDGQLYNTHVVALPDGRIQSHRKLHTFISQHMSSGQTHTVFDTPFGWRLGVLTCWDNNLVENARAIALQGADLLLAPHQTGGCDSRSPEAMGVVDAQLWHQRDHNPEALRQEFQGPKGRGWLMRWLPARAHDNGFYLAFSNGVGLDDDEVRTGNAMIIGPYGDILQETTAIDNAMVVADCQHSRLALSTGRRWLRGRRPELYQSLTASDQSLLSPHEARFSKQ